MVFPFTTVFDETWDEEWHKDWRSITEIFDTIDYLEQLFDGIEVSKLRRLTQEKMILDLRKYSYSLTKVIREKYSED